NDRDRQPIRGLSFRYFYNQLLIATVCCMTVEEEPREWVHLDPLGRVIEPFAGTAEELVAHLSADMPRVVVTGPTTPRVYLAQSSTKEPLPLIAVRTPWSSQRWTARSGAAFRPNWTSWLMRT